MKPLLFLQSMRSLPLWGTGTAHPQDEKVRVGAADNSSAGLRFCRVVVQVMVWKEVYFALAAVATRFSTPLPAPPPLRA